MTGLTVQERDDLAEALASHTAPWLTYGVHTRDEQIIARALHGLDRQELYALAVVLAKRCPQPLTRPDDGVTDMEAVRRACAGQGGPMTRQERRAAVRILLGRGSTPTAIARTLHLSGATTARLINDIGNDKEPS